jgi:hypothetical protein
LCSSESDTLASKTIEVCVLSRLIGESEVERIDVRLEGDECIPCALLSVKALERNIEYSAQGKKSIITASVNHRLSDEISLRHHPSKLIFSKKGRTAMNHCVISFKLLFTISPSHIQFKNFPVKKQVDYW